MRVRTGKGIKVVAPCVGINYTYLSKLENDEKLPSAELIERLAKYYGQDPTPLMIAAGRVPPDVLEILATNPEKAVAFLREQFGRRQS